MFATTGFYRVSNVYTRQTDGLNAQVTPGATVVVTVTATGLAATIYSDPLLTQTISNATVYADVNGNYSYYIPLNYMVTETISSPSQGGLVINNVGQAGPLVTSLSTTPGVTTYTISMTGITASSHVSFGPTNPAAISGNFPYVLAKTTGSLTVVTSGLAGVQTYDLIITPY